MSALTTSVGASAASAAASPATSRTQQMLHGPVLPTLLRLATPNVIGLFAMTVVIGYGTRDAALAGLALLLGHALFKSSLFLVVGVIDRQLSTRDITELSGVAKQAPTLAVFSAIAVASMAGIIYQWLANPEMPLTTMFRQLKSDLRARLEQAPKRAAGSRRASLQA